MSGPIVRKYGFPNFEKIFGQRPLEHGVEDDDAQQEASQPQADEAVAEDEGTRRKSSKKTGPRPQR